MEAAATIHETPINTSVGLRKKSDQLLMAPLIISHPGRAQCIYLDDELRAGDVKLFWGQDTLLRAHVLQHHSQIDQAVSHYVLILSWKDVLLNNSGCRQRGGGGGNGEHQHYIYAWDSTCPSLGANILCMGDISIAPWVSQKVSDGLWLYSLTWALRWTFSTLANFCLLIAVTEKAMGCPATGALSKVRKTAIPLEEPAEGK